MHLRRHKHHLVERRRDQAAEADDVGLVVDGGLQDLVGRHHHAEVDHLVVVAAEHDADDVLADVVDVAFDGGHDQLALGLARAAAGLERLLLGFHERLEIGDRPLHRAGALDHLRQEHLAGAEQLADDLHAVHQRSFDDEQRPPVLRARFFGVLLDEIDHAVHERVRQPRLDRAVAPLQIGLPLRRRSLHLFGEGDHALGRIGPPVEDDVLDVLEEILRDVLVDDQLPGVDDAHVHAGLDGVEQERGMNRLADDVVSSEGERQVADAAADLHAGADALMIVVASMKYFA